MQKKLNGRLAMISFISLVALEAITGLGIVGFLTSLSEIFGQW